MTRSYTSCFRPRPRPRPRPLPQSLPLPLSLALPLFLVVHLFSLSLPLLPHVHADTSSHGGHLHSHDAHLLKFPARPPQQPADQRLNYGQSVCTTLHADLVVIGANGYDRHRGAVYVYNSSVASSSSSGASFTERLGISSPLSWSDLTPTVVSPSSLQAAETRSPKELRAQGRGSGFGFSCAVSSLSSAPASTTTLLIGAPGHDLQRGVVYVLRRSSSSKDDGEWKEVDQLHLGKKSNSISSRTTSTFQKINSERRNGDGFGWDVGTDASCTVVAASARGRRAHNGEVVLFGCVAGCVRCVELQRLAPPDFTDTAGPRGIRIRNNFGTAVAVSGDGSVVIVGATGYDSERGAVYVYKRNEKKGDYKYIQRLESGRKQAHGFFGFKIAVDARGGTIAATADGEDDYRGAVYVFERVNNGTDNDSDGHTKFKLSAQLRREEEKRHAEDNFGGSVAMSADGNTLAVGAPGAKHGELNDHGVVIVYERESGAGVWKVKRNTWLPRTQSKRDAFFAWSVAMSGDGKALLATAPDWSASMGVAAVDTLQPPAEMSDAWYDKVTTGEVFDYSRFDGDGDGEGGVEGEKKDEL